MPSISKSTNSSKPNIYTISTHSYFYSFSLKTKQQNENVKNVIYLFSKHYLYIIIIKYFDYGNLRRRKKNSKSQTIKKKSYSFLNISNASNKA